MILLLSGCSKRTLPPEESLKVQLQWPENDQVLTELTSNLDWASFPGQNYYRIKIWRAGEPDPLIDDFTRGSSFGVDYELADGTYEWAVCVVEDGEDKFWSDTLTFHLSLIVLPLAPDGGEVLNDTRVYFDWLSFPQANGYRVLVWEEGDPSAVVFDHVIFTSSAKANVPFFNGDYCWTVGTRYAEETEFGRWSDTLCFEVAQYPYRLVDTVHTRSEPRDVLPFFDALYVGDGSSGFLTCDRSDPLHPEPLFWDEPAGQDVNRAIWADSIRKLVVVSDYRGTHPVLFYDADIPTAPVWSDWSGIWGRKNQDVDGIWYRDTLFMAIADYDNGAFLFDLSDTVYQSVSTRGNLLPAGYTYGVALDGDYMFTVAGQRGLYISHLDDPGEVIGWIDTPGESEKCDISGDYCYIADGIGGFTVVDVSNPAEPVIVGRDNPQVGAAQKIRVQGDFCYVAYGSGGTKIYDVSSPSNPVVVQEIDGMYSYAASPDDNIIYIADRDWGIMVLQRD